MRQYILVACVVLFTFSSRRVLAQDVIELFDGQLEGEQVEGPLTIEASGVQPREVIRLDYKKRGGSIYVAAQIASKDVYFVFDTGAATVTLTPEFARAVKLMPGRRARKIKMMTANGPAVGRVGKIPALRFGGASVEDVTFVTCGACGKEDAGLGAPVVGLLGMNVLGDYAITLDESIGVVELRSRASVAPAGAAAEDGFIIESGSSGGGRGAVRLPFVRSGETLMVEAKVQGKPVYFVLDTGATTTTLTGRFAKRVGIKPGKRAPVGLVSTAGGVRETRYGLIGSLDLAGRLHSGVSFSICDACGFGQDKGKRPLVGLLGMNVLGRYSLQIDDDAGVVELTPNQAWSDRAVDIQPWVELDAKPYLISPQSVQAPAKWGYKVRVRNRAERSVEGLVLTLTCFEEGGRTREAVSDPVRVRARASATVKLDAEFDRQCVRVESGFSGGRW